MKVSIDQAVVKVNECMSSVFTKEDVLNLLQSIEVKASFDKEIFVKFVKQYVEEQVEELETCDILDLGSAEFCLNGNEIELEDIRIDTGDLTKNILCDIDSAVDELFFNLGYQK